MGKQCSADHISCPWDLLAPHYPQGRSQRLWGSSTTWRGMEATGDWTSSRGESHSLNEDPGNERSCFCGLEKLGELELPVHFESQVLVWVSTFFYLKYQKKAWLSLVNPGCPLCSVFLEQSVTFRDCISIQAACSTFLLCLFSLATAAQAGRVEYFTLQLL